MKKVLLTALQFAIAAGALWFVFHDPAKRAEMGRIALLADPWWLLLGVAVYGGVEAVGAARWHLLLRVQDIRISAGRTLWLVMIGVFYNFVIPGGTGGDVVKAFYLMKETSGQRALALLSIFVDRALGLVTLVAIAGALLGVHWGSLTQTPPGAVATWTAAAILGVLAGTLIFSLVIARFRLLDRLPERLPGRDKIAEIGLAFQVYSRARGTMAAAALISIVSHLGTFFTFYCAARALSPTALPALSFMHLSAVIPVVNTLGALTPSGVGVREGLFQVFVGSGAGGSDTLAAVIGTTGWLLSVVWGVVGGILYAAYRPSEHSRLREIRSDMKVLEHSLAEQEAARERTIPS